MFRAFLASLFGFKKTPDKCILDGPGMINPFVWDEFSVSRTDSYAQHNFYISVESTDTGYYVKGSLRDEDGTEYEENEGILLSASVRKKIDELAPCSLSDAVCNESTNDFTDDVFVLDAPDIRITVKYTDGKILKKADNDDFSIKVYNIVLPCFRDKYGQN